MSNNLPYPNLIIEPLTRRERVILQHLFEDKSNQEIAARESLALSSVKWYVQQVCAKLGVRKRGEAVERGRELGLLSPAPALSTTPISGTARNNLPLQLTSFIGRESEISELQLLLGKPETRLLTLTGSGGTGKTRLALRIGEELVNTFPDGVWLADLAPLSDPLLVPQAVVTALGQMEQPGKTGLMFLSDYFREKKLLLILDNCEHLVEACAELAVGLLRAAPGLKILVTSRERLGVAGEIPYRVPPLSSPDPKAKLHWETIIAFDAVRLFVERAQVVLPGFAITPGNAVALAQIAIRLDGIPLALELAAARLNLLSPAQIASRLDDVFRMLSGGDRTALPRHQTLQALIDWSYYLLSEPERGLLCRLSVFAGSWTLEAAEAVCIGNMNVLNLLGQLADKSLIGAVLSSNGEMRYHMLETLRQYAHVRLVEAGEEQAARNQHLAYYLGLAERLEPKLHGHEQLSTLDELDHELDNLRLALEWSLGMDIEVELRLASALQEFWYIRYHHNEAITWLQHGLESEARQRGDFPPQGERALIRARALTALGFYLVISTLSFREQSKPILKEALWLYQENEPAHPARRAWTLLWLGHALRLDGDILQAHSLANQSLQLFRQSGDLRGMAECNHLLGDAELDPLRRKAFYEEMLAINETIKDINDIANSYSMIGEQGYSSADYTGASTSFEASVRYYRQVGNQNMVAFNLMLLAIAYHLNGDLERAVPHLEQALSYYRGIGNHLQVAFCLFWKCYIAFELGSLNQVEAFIEESGRIATSAADRFVQTDTLYLRARLARMHGETVKARRFAEEGLISGAGLGFPLMLIKLELGYLALQENDLGKARTCFQEGLQDLLRWRDQSFTSCVIDGMAQLAVREGRMERAARLFGTKLWSGFAHTITPVERAERAAAFAEIRDRLGVETFEQLCEEGRAMSFMQVLELMQEDGEKI